MPPEKVITPPADVHIEGGDVMPWNDHIFIGTYKGADYKEQVTARTNMGWCSLYPTALPS